MRSTMDKVKILNALGLASKAGKIIIGEQNVLAKIKSREAKLVFLAADTGINTSKRITDKCNFYEVVNITDFTTSELNKAIGKRNCKVIAITDNNFVKLLEKHMR